MNGLLGSVELKILMLLKILLFLVVHDIPEHGTVSHVMAIEDAVVAS